MSASELLIGNRVGILTPEGGRLDVPWLVTNPTDINGATCDARYDAQLPRLGTGLLGIPHLLVKNYRLARKLGVNIFHVDVEYESPYDVSWTGEWTVSVSGALETKHILTEVQTASDIADGVEPKVIGPYAYNRDADDLIGPSVPDSWKYKAGAIELWLEEDGSHRRRIVVGADRLVGSASVNATRRFEGTINASLLMKQLGTINANYFAIGWAEFAKGTLLFTAFTVREEPNATVQSPPTVDYIVELQFLYKYGGHQLMMMHTYEDDKLGELLVRHREDVDGKPQWVWDNFRLQLASEFSHLRDIKSTRKWRGRP